MRRTKIVCTIGPSSRDEQVLSAMAQAGMDVARLNFSHGTHEYHRESIETIRRVRDKCTKHIAVMLDTRGPEIRVGDFEGGEAFLKEGQNFTFCTKRCMGDSVHAYITYADLPAKLAVGDTVLVDDGAIRMRVESCTDEEISCTVLSDGRIADHKGVNVPNVRLDMPYLSEADKADLLFGIEMDVDFIAASFVRSAEDVETLRSYLAYNGGDDILIIAKIENSEGIDNFDSILRCADGIMVARGDMGVEVAYERLPGIQKRFIRKCYSSGKMVITATQMLESMVSRPMPTRAEITDIANAVFDGTSAVMLSGETAAGKYPVEAVKAMARIAEQAETDAFELNAYANVSYDLPTEGRTNAVCDAACTTARDINAKAIIALTKYGDTARFMSKFRPAQVIVAASPVEKTCRQLSLSWGVYPVLSLRQTDSDKLFAHAMDCARALGMAQKGDIVVIAGGIPLDTPGSTNILKVDIVGQRL